METFQVDTSHEVPLEYVYCYGAGAGMLCDEIPSEWVQLICCLAAKNYNRIA